jgi:hypothetical protein
MGCIGFEAEVHKIAGRAEADPFSFQAISVVFIHRGELYADFESASMVHNFTNGGLLILPAGSSAAFKLADVDLTVIYLRPDQLAGIERDCYSQLEIVPQIVVEWSTGHRVSSILMECRLCDVILAAGREQITFLDTKNGEPWTATLHPWVFYEQRH